MNELTSFEQSSEMASLQTDYDLEKVILGALLTNADAIFLASAMIKPEYFHHPKHQAIFTVMLGLYENSIPIDLLTMTDACQKANLLNKIGGPAYLSECAIRVVSSANLEYHLRILTQGFIRRTIHSICNNFLETAMNRAIDSLELLANINAAILKINDEILKSESKSILNLTKEFLQSIKNKENQKIEPLTGLDLLDKAIDGREDGDFIVIGGRPGMGKSSIINNILNTSLDNNTPTYFLSLEMTPTETLQRLVSARTAIDGRRIKKGDLNQVELELIYKESEKIAESSLIIEGGDGSGRNNIFDFRARIIALKRTRGIKVAILDRICLMDYVNPNGTPLEEIKRITKILRRTANELGITIVAISQLSRAVEGRGGSKKPQLSDLRDSGSIEQDARKVILLYRPEYYGMRQDTSGESLEGVGIIIVAKNTGGITGELAFRFDAPTTQFKNFDEAFD